MIMESLEKLFISQHHQPLGGTAASEKQQAFLVSQIRHYYPDDDEIVAINRLLNTAPKNYDLTHPLPLQFLSQCQQLGFVGFSLLEMGTKVVDGERKKDPRGYPPWKQITRENFEHYIVNHHRAFAFLTGHLSNITVIDCDSRDSYNAIVRDYPELAKTLTVSTRQGFHIYCQYDGRIKTTNNNFRDYPKVDIRNDGGILFAPPTRYDFFGEPVAYEFVDINSPIVGIPQGLIDNRVDVSDPDPLTVQQITHVGQLTRPQMRHLLYMLHPKSVKINVVHTSLVCNGLFEIGYQPRCTTHAEQYYMKFFELMVLNINHKDWSKLLDRVNTFSGQLTFYIYETTHGYHLYCVNRPIFFKDNLARKIEGAFEVDVESTRFSLYNGFQTRISMRSDDTFIERYIGQFGQQPPDYDLTTLVALKDALISQAATHAQLSEQALKSVLDLTPFPQLHRPHFTSFHIAPRPETSTEDHVEA